MRPTLSKAAIVALLTLGLGACVREGDIFESGILTTYTACPAVAIPAPAGDVTLFDPPASRDASAIDVVATMTDLRSNCDQAATENIVTSITFNVEAIRRDEKFSFAAYGHDRERKHDRIVGDVAAANIEQPADGIRQRQDDGALAVRLQTCLQFRDFAGAGRGLRRVWMPL